MSTDAGMSSNSNKINFISASTGMQEKFTWVSADGRKKQDLIKWLSPVAWQHINLLGNMSFLRRLVSMNIQELIETAWLISEIDYGVFWAAPRNRIVGARNRFLQYHALRKVKATSDKHLQRKNSTDPSPWFLLPQRFGYFIPDFYK